jgi:diadenosine tetraphosphate (Ap4A) HIT family hydrolase
MKLRHLKYALLFSAALGTGDVMAALQVTDLQYDCTSHSICMYAVATATVGGTTYSGNLTSTGGAQAMLYLNTTKALTFDSGSRQFGKGAGVNSVSLTALEKGDITLGERVIFSAPTSGYSLTLQVGNRVTLGALTNFAVDSSIAVLADSTLVFGALGAGTFAANFYIAAGKVLTIISKNAHTFSGKIAGGGTIYWVDENRGSQAALIRSIIYSGNTKNNQSGISMSESLSALNQQAVSPYDPNNIFAKILAGSIPCAPVFENEHVLAFNDISPKAKVHVLVIPKGAFVCAHDFHDRAASDMIVGFHQAISAIVKQLGLDGTGYRLISNAGPHSRQEVPHYHVHILGGEPLPGF